MKTRFAKLIALLLVLCLCPLSVWAEETVPLDDTVTENLIGSPDSFFVLDDHLYAILSYAGIYQQVEGGWKQALSFGSFDCLGAAVYGNSIYLLSYTYDEDEPISLWRSQLVDGALTPVEQLATIDLDFDADSYPQLYGLVADDDSLWMLLYDFNSSDWGKNDLYRISLADGSATKVTQTYLSSITSYTDGKLLAYSYNYTEDNPHKLLTVDKTSGEMEELCILPDSVYSYIGLLYDVSSGYTYISDSNHLYRFDSTFAEATLCAYLTGVSVSTGSTAAIFNDMYYLPDWSDESNATVCSIDPSLLPTRVLRLDSFGSDEMLRGFVKEHPEIAVEITDTGANTAEAISLAMTTGDNSADIFSVYLSSGPYESLRRKGYYYDLSNSEILRDFIDRMYPQFSNVLVKDDQICAIPESISAYTLSYFPNAFEKVGLTEEDVPTTMMEMLDFIQMWAEDYADEYPEIELFQWAYDLRSQLFSMIFSMQISYCSAHNETLTFDTPVIRALLARLDELTPILDELTPDDDSTMGYVSDDNSLFNSNADFLPNRYGLSPEWNGYPFLLSLSDDMDPVINVNVTAYIVNPRSENIDLAITFLEYIVEHMAQDTKIILLPDENEPCEYEYYQQQLESYEQNLAQLQESMANASEDEKAMYEDSLEWLEEYRKQVLENRWAISEEDIANYRAIAPYLTALSTDLFSGSNNEASTLMQRYLDGQINAEQFIKEFSRIILMIQMENE